MPLEKRSFSLSGHRTSVALEPQFWAVLERMAAGRLAALVATLDAERTGASDGLASSLRVAALTFLQKDAGQAGHGPKTGPVREENPPCPAPPPPSPALPAR